MSDTCDQWSGWLIVHTENKPMQKKNLTSTAAQGHSRSCILGSPNRRQVTVYHYITRKPSWRIGKRTRAVHIWRPLVKKSTANQRYAISDWWLILTIAALLAVCEIFSSVEAENRYFAHCIVIVVPLHRNAQQYQCNLCIALKYI